MENFWNDLRYVSRGLRRSPGYTAVAVVTLALGIGATTAIFNALEASLTRALPYREPDRLVHLWETTPETKQRQLSYPDLLDLRERPASLAQVAAYGGWAATWQTGSGVVALEGARVTANFFDVLGVTPLLGRGFLAEEDRPDRVRDVVVLGHGAWLRRFGGDPTIVGRTIELDGAPMTVVGVLPPEFQFARSGDPEIWVTLSPPADLADRRYTHWLRGVARLADGVGLDAARAELATLAAARAADDPRWHGDSGLDVQPLADALLGTVRPLLVGLLAGAALVLAVACANVAGMSLARATGRERELAVRAALGAGTGRLARLFLAESLLLALAGGAAGFLVSLWAARALVAALPAERARFLPFLDELEPRPALAGFALLVALAVALATGLLPALRALRRPARALAGGRGNSVRRDARSALLVAEIALALVLVSAAGLLVRSVGRLVAVETGLPADEVLTARIALPEERYDSVEKHQAWFGTLDERLEGTPGVRGFALVNRLPLAGAGNTGTPTVLGREAADSGSPEAQLRIVSGDYFATLGIPVVAGRSFERADRPESTPVVVVNRRFVDEVLAGVVPGDAVGERIDFVFRDGEPPLEIVGVVGNEAVGGIEDGVLPAVYFASSQVGDPATRVVLRVAEDAGASPEALAGTLAAAARELEPEVLVDQLQPLGRLLAESPPVFARRFPLLLLGGYAALALLLAAVGIYGVLAWWVAERTREIGIRMAIGARAGEVQRLVVGSGLRLALTGIGIGMLGAVGAGFLLSRLLYATSPADPPVLLAAAATLLLVALAACLVPARRAARVDPVVALRCD